MLPACSPISAIGLIKALNSDPPNTEINKKKEQLPIKQHLILMNVINEL